MVEPSNRLSAGVRLRVSAEERDRLEASALRNGLFGRGAVRLAHEVEASWNERDAARRALRDCHARIRAAVALAYPDDMTPAAKRMFDSISDEFDAMARAVVRENTETE